MSAMHTGNLHGSGTKTNKTRYHYARQRVQEAQKGKLAESDVPKREPEVKFCTQNILLIGLIVLIVVTWGVAATAYFGIIDYKRLVAKSSNITSSDATEYASSLYPFQYEAARHPLKYIGTFLTAIDDTVTNFFTITEAPFQIIDKRRVVTIAPVRLIKKKFDLSKREAEQPQAEAIKQIKESESKQPEDVVETEKPQEQSKQAEPRKPSEDNPQSSRDPETKQLEQDKNAEKPKDVTLILNLHLFVGQDHTISETHLVFDNGSILRIGIKTSTFPQKNSKITPKYAVHDKKALSFSTSPINKANIVFCHGNPPVRRLVLDGIVINKLGYGLDAHNFAPSPPSGLEVKEQKIVVASIPIHTGSFAENFPLVAMANSKILSHHGNGAIVFEKNLVVDTSPSGNMEILGKNGGDKNSDLDAVLCRKACFLELRFLNKNFYVKNQENGEKFYVREGKLTTSSYCMNKLTKIQKNKSKIQKNKSKNHNTGQNQNPREKNHGTSELPDYKFSPPSFTLNKYQILSENHPAKRQFHSKITLPNVVSKYPIKKPKFEDVFHHLARKIVSPNHVMNKNLFKKPENPKSDDVFHHIGQKIVLPNPVNKNLYFPQPENDDLEFDKCHHFGQKLTIHSETISMRFLSENEEMFQNGGKTTQKRQNLLQKRASSSGNPKIWTKITKSVISKEDLRKNVFSSSSNRYVRDTSRFAGWKILHRGMQNPNLNKFIRHGGKRMPIRRMPIRRMRICKMPIRGMRIRRMPIRRMPIRGMPIRRMSIRGMRIRRIPIRRMRNRRMPIRGMRIRRMPIRIMPIRRMTIRRMRIRRMPFRGMRIRRMPIRRMPIRRMPIRRMPMRRVPIRRMPIRRITNPNGKRIVRRPFPGQKVITREISDPSSQIVIRNAKTRLIRRVQNVPSNKMSQNVRLSFPHQKAIIRSVSNPHSNKFVRDIKIRLAGRRILSRGVENPLQSKPSRNARSTIFDHKIRGRMVAFFKVSDFVRTVVPHKKRLLFSRLTTAGTRAFARQISMSKLRQVPGERHKISARKKLTRLLFSRLTTAGTGAFMRQISMSKLRQVPCKRHKISPRKKITPREKLKRKFFRIFDRTCDVISAVANVIRKLNIFERSYKILPKRAQNYLQKAKNITIISKILDVMVNTTLSDAFQFSKTTGEVFWQIIHEKCTKFYNFLKKKPSLRNFFSRLSKFGQKLQLKFEKLSDIIGKNFVMLQRNQKLLTSVLVTLSVIGLYHIFFSCFNTIFRPR